MTTIATICARGNSQTLPGKNIRPLIGKPLINYTIEQALSCKEIDKVYVSTDSEEIAKISEKAGAIVPFIRSNLLAESTTPKIPVIQNIVEWIVKNEGPISTIVDLDPTSPLRDIEDIQACIKLLNETTDVVFTVYESDKNPYFNMVEANPHGQIQLVKGDHRVTCRQNAPQIYSMNASIYVWHYRTLEKGLWDGQIKIHVMPRIRSVDIDCLLDFKIVELLMKEKLSV
jgi:CMP-N-acetylneuraminic acid synthetase